MRAWLEQQWATYGPDIQSWVGGAVVVFLLLSFLTTMLGQSGPSKKRGGKRGH